MNKPEVGKPYKFEVGGEELGKVLFYYGLISDVNEVEQKIVCPFHEDYNPSMIVNLHDGKFFCFGCNKSGNAYDFVESVEQKKGNTGLKVLKKFFEILKSDKVERLKVNTKMKTKKESEELYNMAYDYFYGLSKIDWKTSDLEEVNDSKAYMLKRGFTPNTLNKCGARVTFNKSYPIIFPMLDNGKFKGWVCRTNNPDIEKKRKYLYNGGFMRRTTLVGDYAGCKYVIIVEGYMDRLKFVQFGVEKGVCAILGWKMSQEQQKKLRDANVKYVISALDNDTCGRKGTEYLKTVFGEDRVVRWQYLKGIKDCGETNKGMFFKMYDKTIKLLKEKMYEKESKVSERKNPRKKY